MAGLHLVTGYKGAAHITSADQGIFNAMSVGANDYVFSNGRRFEAQIISNNAVRIYDGSLLMNGRQVNLDSGSYLDAIISNGTAGMYRNDIIAMRYEKNTNTGVESVSLVVGTGTATSGTPTDPDITYPDSIVNGASVHDMPLYRVRLNGITIESVEPLFQVLAPMADFQHGFYKQNLLINGDFQCNQRGRTQYVATGKVMYSVDMWRAYNIVVNVRNDGIEIRGSADTQGYLTQFIQLGKLETKTYTISAMVDGKVYTFTVTPGGTAKEKDFGKFKLSALTTSTWDNTLNDYNNKLKVNFMPVGTKYMVINYIDVFEGTVAYPHVKEDPATAMMRCRSYLQVGVQTNPYMWYKTENSKCYYGCVLSYEPMVRTPRFEEVDVNYYHPDLGYAFTDIDSGGVTLVEEDSLPLRYLQPIEINLPGQVHERCFGFIVNYRLSCEHNPNGD